MHRGADAARNQRGALMMFVLLAMLMVSVVTLGVLRLVSGDITEGFGGLEAVQAFNIAEAGVHYAIGRLQTAGANTYTGGTLTVTAGTTPLGTATITVNCIDTGNSPTVNKCSGTYAGYRRIVSTSTLPSSGASGGPTRTIVAIVYGVSSGGGAWPFALCATGNIVDTTNDPGTDAATIFADLGANGQVDMTPSGGTTVTISGGAGYTGKLSYGTSYSCGSGCSAAGGYVNGGASQCQPPPLPTFTPGATDLPIAAGTTYTIPATGGSFRNVSLARNNGSGFNPCGTGLLEFTTLVIQTNPGATTVVQMNTLSMDSCTRLEVDGSGTVDLRLGDPHAQGLVTAGHMSGGAQPVHFGVAAGDLYAVPKLLPAKQLIVWINSDGTLPPPIPPIGFSGLSCDKTTSPLPVISTCAGFLQHGTGGATIVAPNGPFQIDDDASTCAAGSGCSSPFHGAILTQNLLLSDQVNFFSDTGGVSGLGTPTWSNFNQLRSWKDQ